MLNKEFKMDPSFYQIISLTCANCSTTVEGQVWLIINTTNRPDLRQRLYDETLRDLTCPNCQQLVQHIDAPLLLYRPGKTPLLFFSPDPFALPDYLYLLGDILLDAYEYEGRTEYLTEAIQLHKAAIERTSPDNPDYLRYLTSLVSVLRSRYTRTGQLIDLQEAINLMKEGLDQVPADFHAMHGMLQYNLGQLLLERYERTQEWKDLEQVITHFQDGAQNFPPNSLMQARTHNALGNALRRRYLQTGQQTDLEKTIEALQTSIRLQPPDSPELAEAYNDLGNALRDRYARTTKLEDLEEAIKVFKKAEQLLQNNLSINRPIVLSNLGNALRDYYIRLKQREALQQTREVCEEACQRGTQVVPEVALGTARFWGNWEADQGDWAKAAHAYTYAVQALEHLYRVQFLQADREHRLSEVSGLYIRATYTMAGAGQLRAAVTTLEQGRAKRLSEALARDQVDLQDIQEKDSETYQLYLNAADRLHRLEQAEREGRILNFTKQAQIPRISRETWVPGEQISRAREDLEEAIRRIRRIPGHENFLTQPTFQDITKVTLPGVPLVYLVTTQRGSLILLVKHADENPEMILADALTEEHLEGLLIKGDKGLLPKGGYLPGQLFGFQTLSQALTEILPQLGTHLVGPLGRRLAELGASGVVLIPTGWLGILPLHAASYQSNGRETVFIEDFDVAYVPSARVLAVARVEAQTRQRIPLHFLGVGNPLSPPRDIPPAPETQQTAHALPGLIYARAEVETIVRLLTEQSSSALYEDQATLEGVWKNLPQATTAHFACHGLFDI
jgi:tetratricopeptide (TPR) repeat protein